MMSLIESACCGHRSTAAFYVLRYFTVLPLWPCACQVTFDEFSFLMAVYRSKHLLKPAICQRNAAGNVMHRGSVCGAVRVSPEHIYIFYCVPQVCIRLSLDPLSPLSLSHYLRSPFNLYFRVYSEFLFLSELFLLRIIVSCFCSAGR